MSDSGFLQMLVPLAGFGVNVFTQIVLCRFAARRIGLLKTVYAGFVLGLGVVAAAQAGCWFAAGEGTADPLALLAANVIIYGALGYGYFHFINLGETARRVRILREIRDAADGMSMSQIMARYSARMIVNKRIERLVGTGQVVLRNQRYYIGKPTVLRMSRAILFMKLVILGKKSEFD